MRRIQWPKLAAFVLLTEGIGFLSALLAGNTKALYERLYLPPGSPPAWLFGVMWPILYALMGIAAYLVDRSGDWEQAPALQLYWLQMAVNFTWSILFTRFRLFWISTLILALLIVLAALLFQRFARIDPGAGFLLLPYFIWILYAAYLNLGVALLN